jgi:alpha-mannosidase
VIQHLDYTRRRFLRTAERLHAALWSDVRPVDELLVAGPVDRISYEEAQRLDYRIAKLGERFGPLWATYWFKVRATVPEEWRGERVELRWYSDSEATLWRDGRVVVGINRHHGEATLADHAEPGEVAVEVELACNGLFGKQDRPVELHRVELARFDTAA